MPNPLFSTYTQGENRVTASILAVFERISFALVEQILQALLGEPEIALLTYRNQPPGPSSVPDARIRASFSYWLEVKIAPGAVDAGQLKRHLEALKCEPAVDTQRLLLLTPDGEAPVALEELGDPRVAWASFDDLRAALEDALHLNDDPAADRHVASEHERWLLRELVRFLISEGLVARAAGRVLVVPARSALPEYRAIHAYICQPNRTFQPASHMAFYAESKIHPWVPRIFDSVESVVLSRDGIEAEESLSDDQRQRLLDLLDYVRQHTPARIGEPHKVVFLTAPGHDDTLELEHPIVNDLTSASGRTVAFTQNQRYVSLDALQWAPKTTSELLARDQGR
jgi:hypothetical protein